MKTLKHDSVCRAARPAPRHRRALLRRVARGLGLAALVAGVAPRAARGADAPYVNAQAIRERFDRITEAEVEALRGKKILFASRSFGLNLMNGFRRLEQENPKLKFPGTYARYDVFRAGGDLSAIPADAFEKSNFVHFLCTYWPHGKRVEETNTLMRQAPHNFGRQVDAVVIFFHTARPEDAMAYGDAMDALRRDFPNARVIYVTSGFSGPKFAENNGRSAAFGEAIRARYRGKAPLYDLGAILSDDFRVGNVFAPEYSVDPAELHPSAPAGELLMAKGFLLTLVEAFRQPDPPTHDGASNPATPTPRLQRPPRRQP